MQAWVYLTAWEREGHRTQCFYKPLPGPMREVTSGWNIVLVLFGCLLCGQWECWLLPRESPVGVRRAWFKCLDLAWSGRWDDGRKHRKFCIHTAKPWEPHRKPKGSEAEAVTISPKAGNSLLVFASARAPESWLLKYLKVNQCSGTWLKDSWVWCPAQIMIYAGKPSQPNPGPPETAVKHASPVFSLPTTLAF